MTAHTIRNRLLITVCLTALPAAAWTVRNTSPSALVTNSLPWVAAQVNAGSPDTSIHFDVTNPPPRVFTFSVDFYRRVTFSGSPDVLFANVLRFYGGADILSIICSNAALHMYGSGGYIWNSHFTHGGLTLHTNYLFEAVSSAVGSFFTLVVSNVIQGGVTNGGIVINEAGMGNVISNCLLTSVQCRGTNNTFAYNRILGGCIINGGYNTVRRNHISCSWSSSIQVLGHHHTFDGNVVYSNQYGFYVERGGHHTFVRNRIGCDESGLVPLPIDSSGFWLYMSTANQIGGDRDTEANIIVACSNNAAIIDTYGVSNRIEGNFIGIGANGMTPLPNASGLNIQFTSNTFIGSPGRGNIIGANRGAAISATGIGLQIVANRIGTDVHGIMDRANGSGVQVGQSSSAIIAGNTICGARDSYGLQLYYAHDAHVWANHIGVDLPGTAAMPNARGGIKVVESRNVTIGGNESYQRNTIAGNTASRDDDGQGILVGGTSMECPGTRIINNYVGVDATGTNLLGNARAGIHVLYTGNVTIGGTNALEQNIVCGNGGPGIIIESELTLFPATNIIVTGNRITDNGSHGIALLNRGSSNNLITLNFIAGNASNGINIAAGLNNTITSNHIYGNALMGINLGAQGRNDGPESNNNPNRYQRYPFISNVVAAGGTRVRGSFASAASKTYRLEFFASPAASPAGFGEGQQVLGATSITTGAGGGAAFDALLPTAAQPGWIVTATATDPDGNTSEFSEQKPVSGVLADFSANKTLVTAGQAVQFTDHSLGTPTAWYWDFDSNGSVDSTVQNPSHSYATPGDKTVTLVASNAFGAAAETKQALIRVAGTARAVAADQDVQSAIDLSQPYDTLMLSAGVYRADSKGPNPNVLVLDKPLTLLGVGAPGDTIIDGAFARRCLHVISGRVVNITCINGMATNQADKLGGSLSESGGGVLLEAGELERCIVRNCHAVEGGGVRALDGGWIRSSLIISNHAEEGGGLALGDGVIACNLTIADNAASTTAGGVLLSGGQLWNSIVVHNTAPGNENWHVNDGSITFSCAQPHPGDFNSTDLDPGLHPDYTIPLSSPVVDGACTFAWMSSGSDLAGDARLYGSAPDMGAYEAIPEPAAVLFAALASLCMIRRNGKTRPVTFC